MPDAPTSTVGVTCESVVLELVERPLGLSLPPHCENTSANNSTKPARTKSHVNGLARRALSPNGPERG